MKKSTAIIIIVILTGSVFGLLKLANAAESYMANPQTDAELIDVLKSGGSVDFTNGRDR